MLMRIMGFLFLALATPVWVWSEPPRLALVVGNAAYGGDAALKNPVNDAKDVAGALEAAGWQVTLITDADRRKFTRGIVAWGEKLSASEGPSALFYYAGHGMQVDGANYLLPVNTAFDTLSDVKLDAVNLNDVTTVIETSGVQVSLIVLDACRNNPFAKTGTRSVGSANRGLTIVQASGGAHGSATIFSTSPGDVAEDGAGRNGVFTAAFLKQINSDLKLEDLFKKVTNEVRLVTGDRQKPWINTSIGADFYLLGERFRQERATEVARVASEEANKAALVRQAELDRLTNEVRAADAKLALAAQTLGSPGPTVTSTNDLGTLSITVQMAGKLYLDGTPLADLAVFNTATIGSIRPGERALEMHYGDGKVEPMTATVQVGKVSMVAFKYSPPPSLKVGDVGPAGGYVFYDKGRLADGWRYLEAAPTDTGKGIMWTNAKWNDVPTKDGIGTGRTNTGAIIASQGAGSYAAQMCQELVINGYDDWFLPSLAELDLMYVNLKNWDRGSFSSDTYWSSTQFNFGYGWRESFGNGAQTMGNKADRFSIRAVRAF